MQVSSHVWRELMCQPVRRCARAPVSEGVPGCCSRATTPMPSPNSSERGSRGSRGPMPNARSPWGGVGGRLLKRNWIPGRAEQQGAGRPLCPPIIPSPPLTPPSQPPGFKVEFGGCRGLGCHLSVPFSACPLLLGLLHPRP